MDMRALLKTENRVGNGPRNADLPGGRARVSSCCSPELLFYLSTPRRIIPDRIPRSKPPVDPEVPPVPAEPAAPIPAPQPAAPAAPARPAAPGAAAALVLLLSINLFNYIDRQVLSAVLPKLKVDASLFRPDDRWLNTKLGSLTTAFMVSYMLLAPLFGQLGDRRSRWTLVGVGVVLWSLASG